MKTHKIEVKEILTRIIQVRAESEFEAEQIVKKRYKDEEIVLDWSDFNDLEISTISHDKMLINDVLSNGENFFLIEDDYLYFWGKDIKSKRILIDSTIEEFISKYNFNLGEVSEFNQTEDFSLYHKFYTFI